MDEIPSEDTEFAVDVAWSVEAEKRITEIEHGRVKTLPGDEVMARLWELVR